MDYKALLYGSVWNGTSSRPAKKPVFLTYSFPTEEPLTFWGFQWSSFDAADKSLARYALQQWEKACGIRFLEVKGGDAEIKFQWSLSDASVTAYAEFPNTLKGFFDKTIVYRGIDSGNVHLNTFYRSDLNADRYDKTYVLLHEIGHALGLKHPFHTSPWNKEKLPAHLDHISQTVMSYTGREGISHTLGLGPLDVQAIQALYGAPSADGKHVAAWKWHSGKQILTQLGKKANDEIYGVAVKDVIKGGRGNDRIYSFDGNDTLHGGAGRDTLVGGNGSDTYVFDTPFSSKTVDRIPDFSTNEDSIAFSSRYTGLARGSVSVDVFAMVGQSSGPFDDEEPETVLNEHHRIVFDRGKEVLYFDTDGSGPAARVPIVRLAGVTSLGAEDLFIV